MKGGEVQKHTISVLSATCDYKSSWDIINYSGAIHNPAIWTY